MKRWIIAAMAGWAVALVAVVGLGAALIAGEGSRDSALFVLTGTSGTLAPDGDNYTLTLSGVPASTAYFTDRPERSAGAVATHTLAGEVDSAKADPPNAALIAENGDAPVALAFELYSLAYDPATATLTATIRPLAGGSDTFDYLNIPDRDDAVAGLPSSFGATEMFIDALPTPVNGQVTDASATASSDTQPTEVNGAIIDAVGGSYGGGIQKYTIFGNGGVGGAGGTGGAGVDSGDGGDPGDGDGSGDRGDTGDGGDSGAINAGIERWHTQTQDSVGINTGGQGGAPGAGVTEDEATSSDPDCRGADGTGSEVQCQATD